MNASIFAEDGLLEQASVEITEDEAVPQEPDSGETEKPDVSAEDLREYLKKLNPEDFGRFTP